MRCKKVTNHSSEKLSNEGQQRKQEGFVIYKRTSEVGMRDVYKMRVRDQWRERGRMQKGNGITDRTRSLRGEGIQRQDIHSLVVFKNNFLEESVTCSFISCSFSFI